MCSSDLFLLEKLTGQRLEKDVTLLSDEELQRALEHIPAATIVVTVGSQGSILFQRRVAPGSIRSIGQGQILRIPSMPVTPVDTTGAGDAFNGGLAAGLVKFQGDLGQAMDSLPAFIYFNSGLPSEFLLGQAWAASLVLLAFVLVINVAVRARTIGRRAA